MHISWFYLAASSRESRGRQRPVALERVSPRKLGTLHGCWQLQSRGAPLLHGIMPEAHDSTHRACTGYRGRWLLPVRVRRLGLEAMSPAMAETCRDQPS